jgi:hypothetical protein
MPNLACSNHNIELSTSLHFARMYGEVTLTYSEKPGPTVDNVLGDASVSIRFVEIVRNEY